MSMKHNLDGENPNIHRHMYIYKHTLSSKVKILCRLKDNI